MALIDKVMGRHKDVYFKSCDRLAGAAAGTVNDFEIAILHVAPQTNSSYPQQQLRSVSFVFEAAITGAATNNFTLQVNIRRGGAIVGSPLASVTYAAGTNETAYVVHQINIPQSVANTLQGNDVVTIQRVSAGTGLASPAFTVFVDPIPAGTNA